MKLSKSKRKTIALYLLGISFVVLMFNNIGQSLSFLSIPFTKTIQMYVGGAGIFFSFLWYLYLEGAIR